MPDSRLSTFTGDLKNSVQQQMPGKDRKVHKVLYLSKGGHISGAQRQLLYLLRGLDRTRFVPLVLCMQAGRFVQELQDLDVPCIVRKLAGWRRVKQFFTRYADAAYVSRLVRDEGISLVHSSDVWLSEYLLRSAGGAGIPSVLHIRAPIDRRTARRYRCSAASAVVAISKRVEMRLARIAGIPEDKIVLIHDAVDQDSFKPRDPGSGASILREQYDTGDAVLVGIVGRVEPSKEQLDFVKIAGDVLNKTNRAAFFIIGEVKDRSYYSRMTRYITDNGLLGRVHFTGRREDIADVLAGLDVLVSLSGGSVRYEAMMCGATVVCAWSRSPEESYHIRHNETGFLVTPRDRAPVVDVLLDVIEHDELRRRIGRNARIWAEEHLSHSMLVQETQDLYERLLAD